MQNTKKTKNSKTLFWQLYFIYINNIPNSTAIIIVKFLIEYSDGWIGSRNTPVPYVSL